MQVCGFAYKRVSIESKYTKPVVVYRGENASAKLIECLLKEQEEMAVLPIQLSDHDRIHAQNAKICCICKKEFTLNDKLYSRTVLHHCHVTGRFAILMLVRASTRR